MSAYKLRGPSGRSLSRFQICSMELLGNLFDSPTGWDASLVLGYHSLNHAHYASWHVWQTQTKVNPTPVCSGPASERFPCCDGGSSAPLLQLDARCSWAALVSASPVVPNEGLCWGCCLNLFTSHVRSISVAFV